MLESTQENLETGNELNEWNKNTALLANIGGQGRHPLGNDGLGSTISEFTLGA